MRAVFLLILFFGCSCQLKSQTQVKVKLYNHGKFTGYLWAIEDGQFVLSLEDSTQIYIPSDMVKKLSSYRPYHQLPRYDIQRNTWYLGALMDFNTTMGQPNQNFQGSGIHGLVGYDWNHHYSLDLSIGFRNMNIGSPEYHIPVNVSVKKYVGQGRYLPFLGLDAGYQWGVHKSFTESRPIWSSWWVPSEDRKGFGPSITPIVGIRKLGKYGFDHLLGVGIHLQRFASHSPSNQPEDFSELEVMYRRWVIRYGVIF